MISSHPRRRQTARARRRRLRRLSWAATAVATLTAAAGFTLAQHGGASRRVAAATVVHPRPPRTHRLGARLLLPGPIPGLLLIADRGNDRLLLVDGAGRISWRYPRAGGPLYPFRFDDDAFFGPGLRTIVSNQEQQDTIQIIGFPSGRILWRYGHANVRGSSRGYLNVPDDAYELPRGLVSVADAYNCRVLFLSLSRRVVRQLGRTGACAHEPPRALGSVNGATPLPGGGALVSEIAGSWIDAFSAGGRLLWAFRAPVSYPSDPQWLGNGHILLADYARPGHALIVDTSGRILWRYGPASGPGALDHPSLALRIRPGLIGITDDFRHRIVFVSIRSRRIVWQYGHTDRPGTAAGYLNTPDGMDVLPYRRALRIPSLRPLLARAAVHSSTCAGC